MSVAGGRGGPLAHTVLGDSGPWIVFLHGLFGQGKNWTTVAKALADRAQIVLVDLPNHGNSPWTEQFSYPGMAADVADLLVSVSGSEPVVLVGHSMGGKVAMLVALAHPDAVAKLCVVDVSPVESSTVAGFAGYVAGMRGLDLAGLADRAAADAALTFAVPDLGVRSFLLQSLRRSGRPDGPRWRWQLNLDLLGDHLSEIGDWPDTGNATYPGPVLWLSGADSDHVRPEFAPVMRQLFPATRQVRVKNAGHWLHADQPDVFVAALSRFALG